MTSASTTLSENLQVGKFQLEKFEECEYKHKEALKVTSE